tara:strand:- start:22 stop:519 length:498 start_codon:yes stop_codon:yes gene_type:complete
MYIMEFHHTLQEQDLVDIWQGLMPKISTRAELDDQAQSWPNSEGEFFGGKHLPRSEDIRWMVFKVKKKANINYWSMTPSTLDDPALTGNPQDLNPVGLDYSYNWPYDYFSLVELAEIKTEAEFVKQVESGDDDTGHFDSEVGEGDSGEPVDAGQERENEQGESEA